MRLRRGLHRLSPRRIFDRSSRSSGRNAITPKLYERLTPVRHHRYSSQMIVRSRIVAAMDGAPIENGAVAVLKNRIVDVGRFDDVKTRSAGNISDLGEYVLLPGLINTHCHLDYTCLRG